MVSDRGGTSSGGDRPNGADGEGLIDPDLFPLKSTDIDLDGVYAAASEFSGIAERVQNGVDGLPVSWAPLSQTGVYEAPESWRVHQLMYPAVDAGGNLAEGAKAASGALITFTLMLSLFHRLPQRLSALEDEARAFRDEVIGGVPRPARAGPLRLLDIGKDDTVDWYQSLEHANRNQELLTSYANILEAVSEAACHAAETIQNIDGLPNLPDPEPFDADAILASEMPWGNPRDADANFEIEIALGVANTTKALLSSLASLAGWNGETVSPLNALSAWGDLGNSLLGLVMFAGTNKYNQFNIPRTESQIEDLLSSDDPLLRYLGARLRDGESMMMPFVAGQSVDLEDAAQRWSESPWQVGTETALSWAMLFLPGPKVGKNVPLSPAARSMMDDMMQAAELIHTSSGWYTKAGIRVADAAGRWLGDQIYGGTGGPPGGTHMWRPGEPEPTPSSLPGGAHKPGAHRAE